MNTHEFFSVYSMAVTLIALGVIMLVFSMWQLRKRRKRPK